MAVVRRYEDWVVRLDQYFQSCIARPFQWGDFDCALFAANGVKAMTGHDFASHFRGHYHTSRGAARALKKQGFDSLLELGVAYFSNRSTIPSKAQRGDLVCFENQNGYGFGLVDLSGTHFAAVTPLSGLSTLHLINAVTCWRI